MKGYHVHRGKSDSKLEKGPTEGHTLWYTTDRERGWYAIECRIGNDFFGGYSVFEINIPETSITTSVTQNPTKIFKLTKENYKQFAKEYYNKNIDGEKLHKDFAGIDANDESLNRTHVFKAINNGPPSGAIWRFKHTNVSVKRFS